MPAHPEGEDIDTVGASTLSKFTVKALALGELPLDGEAGLGTASAFPRLMRCTKGGLRFMSSFTLIKHLIHLGDVCAVNYSSTVPRAERSPFPHKGRSNESQRLDS